MEPLGQDRELDTREDAIHASDDHGHHESDPREQDPHRITLYTLTVVIAVGTVVGTVISLLRI